MLSLLTALSFVIAPSAPSDTAHLVVVATTDVHGHVTDWDYAHNRPYAGGLVRVATIVDSLRAKYPGQVIVADNGDLIEGDPFATYFGRVAPREPNPVVEAMGLIGCDVATFGSHEFDAGMPALRRAISGAAYPYVSGNIYALAGDTLLFRPYVVLQRGGVRVGVTGFTTPAVMVWGRDQVRSSIRVDRIPAAAARVLSQLSREADVSIALVQSGLDGASTYDTAGVGGENVAAALALLPAPPALVVLGHSHGEVRDLLVNGVHFTQPKPYAGSLSITHISLARESGRWKPVSIRSELISTASVTPSPRLVQRLAPLHAAVRSWAATPLGFARDPMPAIGARAGPSPIISFVNSVQQRRTGADLSATSASDLAAGFSDTVRMADLLALYPFDNTLRAIRITGTQLKQYLEHSAEYFHTDALDRVSLNDSMPGDDFDILSGARYDIDLRRAVGDRIQNLAVKGRPVRPTDSFTLALNSRRQTGAGGYGMIQGATVVYDKGENIRDLLAAELRERGAIDSAMYGQREWRIVPEGSALAVRRLFAVPFAPEPVAAARDTILLRFVATGDLHGTLLPRARGSEGGSRGGVAFIAAKMDSLAAECGCPTLRLDGGDALQGTVTANVTHGRAMVDVLNHLRIAGAVIGERDLAWSLDTLRVRMSEANFPWLTANVYDSTARNRPQWAIPYHMLQLGEYRIALVGYITSDTKTSLKPALTRGLRFDEGALPLHAVLGQLKGQHPDLTILLAHAGVSCHESVCTGEVVRLVEGLEPRTVDLVIAAHSSGAAEGKIGGVPVVQGTEGGAALAVADLVKTSAGGKEIRTHVEPVDTTELSPDAAIAELAMSYRRKAEAIISRPVTTVKFPVTREGDQHRLGMLIAEARRNVLRADVGLVSNGDIRADLPAGPVSYGQLFEIQSSQNGIVRVTLQGRRLQEVLEQALDRQGRPTAHLSGAVVSFDPDRPAGKRIRGVELTGGKKLRPGDTYTLATDDFLSAGGAGFSALAGLPSQPAGMLDVDALMTYLRKLPQPIVVAPSQGFVRP